MSLNPNFFFALMLPALVDQTAARDIIRRLKKDAASRDWEVRWIPAGQLHLTMSFVGPVNDARVADLQRIGALVAAETPNLELEIKGVGGFPAVESARVVWLGVRKTRHLEGLFNRMQSEVSWRHLNFNAVASRNKLGTLRSLDAREMSRILV